MTAGRCSGPSDADAGARRRELDALHLDDHGGHAPDTASVISWRQRRSGQSSGPWLLPAQADHTSRLRTDRLGQWFRTFVRDHGHDGVCLPALRHAVATVLVAAGHLLQAHQRLGHAEASATLRQYCHVLPLHDLDTADHLEALLANASGRHSHLATGAGGVRSCR